MQLKRILNVVRWLVAIGAGVWLFHWVEAGMQGGDGWNPGLAFEIIIALLLYALLLLALFGCSLINKVAGRFAGIYWPDDSNFRIMPEYSLAEARVKEGRYVEAVEEYRVVIAQYPSDIYAHLRIAELAVDHLHDPGLAELELLSAVAKAPGGDSAVVAAGRLADFYQQTLHDPRRAREVMQQLRKDLADSKHAPRIDERIQTLDKMIAGYTVPPPPAKISVRPADQETIRRRRGF